MRKQTLDEWLLTFEARLAEHESQIEGDPQANPVKLLAYDMSRFVETRELAFKDIEALVKILSDRGLIARALRLRERAGQTSRADSLARVEMLAKAKADLGFDAFKDWAESPGQGVVLTAHPTFSLSRDLRTVVGDIATDDDGDLTAIEAHLKTLPYLPKRAPTLQEEHADTQDALMRLQKGLDAINAAVLNVAKQAFPKKWTRVTPCLTKLYSWVGYDIDGRTDISWGDAIRLRLLEKYDQMARYQARAQSLTETDGFDSLGHAALKKLNTKLQNALESTAQDLELFEKDLSNPDNLVAAANNLTRESERRLRSTKALYPFIEAAINGTESADNIKALILLRAQLRTYGLGTARIHFRLNARHVIDGVKAAFGIRERVGDTRTLLEKASELTRNVKPKAVNFASLELEKNTAHQQMILTAQIHKYIDEETPIRLLIAETEDSLTPLGMLYLAKLYGLERHLDISPLFETADGLNNGGRIIGKMLGNQVYRDYIRDRGVFAIQTGFSDAGRFMGQVPATLAIERLQSHFAAELAKHKMDGVSAVIFNTHGESMGRGSHPGNLSQRLDYVMSPWAMNQFDRRGQAFCHETSFQGGDGFLWFQTEDLALASLSSLIKSRYQDHSKADDDLFYKERDFSWDVFRTLATEQDALYHDPDYVTILGGFGQNLLIPTGSRAAKRGGTDLKTTTFNPRQLRAIPHNAILQQFGVPANIFYGIGRAAMIDMDKFVNLYASSPRARSVFGVAIAAMQRSNISILTAYGRLLDPGFWVSRALSGNEPRLSFRSLFVAQTLTNLNWRSNIMDLSNRLRMDVFDSMRALVACGEAAEAPLTFEDDPNLQILHALRLAVLMKMYIIATDLPVHSESGASRLNVMQGLQNLQVDAVVATLKRNYPARSQSLDWTKELSEKTAQPAQPTGFPHLSETVINPLERCGEIMRQITIAITHRYDAFG